MSRFGRHDFKVGDRVRICVGNIFPVVQRLDPGRWCLATVDCVWEDSVRVICDDPFRRYRPVVGAPDPKMIVHLGLLEQIADASTD